MNSNFKNILIFSLLLLFGCMKSDIEIKDQSQPDLSPRVNVKLLLAGPYSGGSMSTSLRSSNLLPLTQPYSSISGINYAGSESVSSSFFNTHTQIVDWVLIELRATHAGTVVARRAGFLLSNGNLLDIDGRSGIKFSSLSEGD